MRNRHLSDGCLVVALIVPLGPLFFAQSYELLTEVFGPIGVWVAFLATATLIGLARLVETGLDHGVWTRPVNWDSPATSAAAALVFFPLSLLYTPISIGLALNSIVVSIPRWTERSAAREERLRREEALEAARLAEDARLEEWRTARRHEEAAALLRRKRDAWERFHRLGNYAAMESASGHEFERFVARLYEAMGFEARLTPTTGDQGIDVVVQRDATRFAIQAKRWKGSVGNTAIQEAYAGAHYYECSRAVVVTTASFTRGAVALASKLEHVDLVDGRKLKELAAEHLPSEVPPFDERAYDAMESSILNTLGIADTRRRPWRNGRRRRRHR